MFDRLSHIAQFPSLVRQVSSGSLQQPALAIQTTELSLLIDSVALMNHSCCPNVIVTYKGTLAEVRAVQEIHPGDEVRANHGARVLHSSCCGRQSSQSHEVPPW